MNECESFMALVNGDGAGQGRAEQAMGKLSFFPTPLLLYWTAVTDFRFTLSSGWPAGRAGVRSLGSQGILLGSVVAPT